MKSWIALLSATSLIGLAALSGCAPTETGNPSLTTSGLTLTAYSSDPTRVGIEAQAGTSSIDRILISVASVELQGCDSAPPATAVAGPFAEDLVTMPRPVHELETTLDRFCGLSTATTPAPHDLDGGPPELTGRTIVIHGQRADGVPFLISSSSVSSLALHMPDGTAVAAEPRRFLLAFDLAHWFSTLDLGVGVVDADGTIHIDGSNNASLLAAFEAAIDGSVSLHPDLDHDGVVDPNEAQINH